MKTVQKYEEIEQYILNLIAEQNLKPEIKFQQKLNYASKADIQE